jgi:hypothetical protein
MLQLSFININAINYVLLFLYFKSKVDFHKAKKSHISQFNKFSTLLSINLNSLFNIYIRKHFIHFM